MEYWYFRKGNIFQINSYISKYLVFFFFKLHAWYTMNICPLGIARGKQNKNQQHSVQEIGLLIYKNPFLPQCHPKLRFQPQQSPSIYLMQMFIFFCKTSSSYKLCLPPVQHQKTSLHANDLALSFTEKDVFWYVHLRFLPRCRKNHDIMVLSLLQILLEGNMTLLPSKMNPSHCAM